VRSAATPAATENRAGPAEQQIQALMVEGPRTASLVLEDQFTQLSKTGEA
jgi:hypothetical protein